MSVEIDPAELGFRRPFTEEEVGQILKIKNPNSDPVAFKVKTTAPKQYCVRPNSGRIEPGHEVEVTVLLQAMKTEPPLDARCRDKFLVQSVSITGDKVFDNIQQIWDSVDKTAATLAQSTINTVKSTAGATYEGLKDQVAHVEAKVSSLTSDATSGLRQRKTGTADPAETGSVPPVKDLAQAVRQGTEGVPIQIVAVLCLLSFLLGYIFF
ncbi:VAMP-associated protein [Coniochaeta sp. PMI_546]|nr:VAMP-associated protein [Coniochaeta sp. PMI_546]